MPSLKIIVPAIALASMLGGAAIAADNTATSTTATQPAAPNSGNTMSSPSTTSSSNTMSSGSMSSSNGTMSKAKHKTKKPASSTMSGQPGSDSNTTQTPGTNPH